MSRLTEQLRQEIQRGIAGENGVINLPLGRVGEYLEISKATMYTIGAESSAGKTSFALDMFMIYPLRYYLQNKDKMNIKLNIIYFGMERAQVMNTAKLVSKLIMEYTGTFIPVKKIMGRNETKLTPQELKLIEQYLPEVDKIVEVLKVYEGHQTAASISRIINEYARENGVEVTEKDDDGKEIVVYKPHHPNHITLILVDHIGLISKDKKEIDEFSEIMRKSKDFWKFSPVIIQQLNRNISDNGRGGAKNRPKLSDFEGSASTQQDSEVVVVVYNPYTHLTQKEFEGVNSGEEVKDACSYDLSKLKSPMLKVPMYRSLHLLKNTYGGAGLCAGLAFHPGTGTFREMPPPDQMTDWEYNEITSEQMFKPRQQKLKFEDFTPY